MSLEVARPEGERKQVTAVFFDLVGFSEVASTADAEDLQNWLEDYYRMSRGIVEANGGEVTEYLGDGIVAVFGLSRADELAALRAVDAAMRVVETIREAATGAFDLALRAGVATGEVAVRAGAKREAWPRITGMVTTLAQRVQEKAAPNTVMISESTKRLLRGRFELVSRPDQTLKGFAEPQTLYRPRDTLRNGPVSQCELVGRDRERAVLMNAEKPVLIIGQAGIGKTALVGHMAERAPAATILHAEGINGGSSYHPFKDWISRHLGELTPGLADIRRGFGELAEQDHLGLALIMGLPEGQVLLGKLSSLALKARIEAALWRAIRSTQSGGLLVFEDLHWFDIASFGVIQHILHSPHLAPSGMQIILTSREDPKLGQHLAEGATEILALDPLSETDAHHMLAVLSGGQIDGAAKARLVERAGGVPLFLEQLYKRAGPDFGTSETVPETLMDLLAARIDDTGPAKPVLQRASAIGRSFGLDMLTALMPEGEDPSAALEQGVAAGVLVRRSEGEFAFAHALLAQAAYHSVLRSTRQALHARIVEVLQERFPGRLARDIAVLARHQMKARQIGAAIRSYLEASKAALLQGAFADAEAHARAAIALCEEAEGTADASVDLAIACQTTLGSILMQVQGFTAEPVRQAFDAVHELARSSPSNSTESAAALFGSFSHAITAGDKRRADGFCDLLGDLAGRLPMDRDGIEVALAALATRNCGCFYQGDFRTQFSQIAEIRKLYRIEDHAAMITRYGMDIFAAAQMFEAPARAFTGEVDKVPDLVAETDAHQAALNIPVMLPYAKIWGAVPLFYAGHQRAALDRLRDGMALADEQGAVFWQITGQTWNFIMDPAQSLTRAGLARFRANLELQRAIGANVGTPYFAACYAERLAEADRLTEAYQVSSIAVKEARESGLHCWYAEILRIHAQICRRDNHPGEAETALKLAVETSKRQGAKLWTLRALLDLAHVSDPNEVDLPDILRAFPPGAQVPEMQRARLLLAP
ncbi:MAG: AAA family ATPase [Roseicyclus sp.]|nr:AAA family ATPase [Roseicyclus sp.]MBO6625597.1 AAA family ATPase [Roseicyclus sp.]MBO6921741.1 AAA family ATPase [Roseicyclus sp.]